MKNLILGIIIGLTCTACCIAKDQSYINHMKVILTDKNYIYIRLQLIQMKVHTEYLQ